MLIGLLAGCTKPEPAAPVEPKTVKDWFTIEVGEQPIEMQLAVSVSEMQKGLMGRPPLEDAQGMLFVYATQTQMSFWMRNTPSALDIGFFTSDGVLRETYSLLPFDERPVRSKRTDLQYALEVRQGEFTRMGIKPGARMNMEALKAAIVARGFEPQRIRGLSN